jgi:hypothetical protein
MAWFKGETVCGFCSSRVKKSDRPISFQFVPPYGNPKTFLFHRPCAERAGKLLIKRSGENSN